MTPPDIADVFGDCSREGCDELCPFDMTAIIFDHETICCSPACAEVVLEGLDTPPETVSLHDPQTVVDRGDLPNVDVDDTALNYSTETFDDAESAITEAADLHTPRFRGGR